MATDRAAPAGLRQPAAPIPAAPAAPPTAAVSPSAEAHPIGCPSVVVSRTSGTRAPRERAPRDRDLRHRDLRDRGTRDPVRRADNRFNSVLMARAATGSVTINARVSRMLPDPAPTRRRE